MRSYIKISGELRARLREGFNVTNKTVWQACAGLSDSDLSRKIRQYALTHGGQWVKEVTFIPKCNTRHFADRSFIQEFPNGVSVLFANNVATILQEGKAIETYGDVSMESWGNVLCHAQAIAEGDFDAMIAR